MATNKKRETIVSLLILAIMPLLSKIPKDNGAKCLSRDTFDRFVEGLWKAYETEYNPPQSPCKVTKAPVTDLGDIEFDDNMVDFN